MPGDALVDLVDPRGDLQERRPVGHGQHRRPLTERDDVAADLTLGFGVERAGHLVQDQQLRPADEGTGQGDTLALATRTAGLPWSDHGLHTLGQLGHELVGAGEPQRLLHGAFGMVAVAQGQVLKDAGVKQYQFLRHIADHGPPSLQVDLRKVDVIDQDRPPCGRCRPRTRSISVVLPAPECR